MIRQEEVYKIGMLAKPHGVKGEVSFVFTDDVFDRADCDYLVCLMDGILVPFFIEEYRFKSDSVALMKFEGCDTAEQARRFTNVEVYFPLHLKEEPESDEWTWDYFVGFGVEDAEHGPLGTLKAVDETTVNTLFVIDRQGQELLVPAHEEFIVDINHGQRTIVLRVPEGLLDLDKMPEA